MLEQDDDTHAMTHHPPEAPQDGWMRSMQCKVTQVCTLYQSLTLLGGNAATTLPEVHWVLEQDDETNRNATPSPGGVAWRLEGHDAVVYVAKNQVRRVSTASP